MFATTRFRDFASVITRDTNVAIFTKVFETKLLCFRYFILSETHKGYGFLILYR